MAEPRATKRSQLLDREIRRKKERAMKTAAAYVSDVILERTKDVITRETQKELIKQHAAREGFEITAWYEDGVTEGDVLSRPGVQKMLADGSGCDTVLVERVWAF